MRSRSICQSNILMNIIIIIDSIYLHDNFYIQLEQKFQEHQSLKDQKEKKIVVAAAAAAA